MLAFQASSLIKNIKYTLDSFCAISTEKDNCAVSKLTVKNWFKNYYEQSNSFHKPGIPTLRRGQDTAKVSRALSGETEMRR